jgi:hypothetical protein
MLAEKTSNLRVGDDYPGQFHRRGDYQFDEHDRQQAYECIYLPIHTAPPIYSVNNAYRHQ